MNVEWPVATITHFDSEVCYTIIHVQENSKEVISIPSTLDRGLRDDHRGVWKEMECPHPPCLWARDGWGSPKCPALNIKTASFFSIVLMALVDDNYRLLWIYSGDHGHISDAQIYITTWAPWYARRWYHWLHTSQPLTFEDHDMLFFLLGDDAFGLRTYLMIPHGRCGIEVFFTFMN